jgi:hypothetical protein
MILWSVELGMVSYWSIFRFALMQTAYGGTDICYRYPDAPIKFSSISAFVFLVSMWGASINTYIYDACSTISEALPHLASSSIPFKHVVLQPASKT